MLATIWHIGTNYTLKLLPKDTVLMHCGAGALAVIERNKPKVVTTYRNPYLVAASWANRYNWNEVWYQWTEQWKCWREMVLNSDPEIMDVANFTGPVVKPTPHDNGAKRAYLQGEMDEYHQHVPAHLIDHALEMIDGIREVPHA